MTSYQVDKSKLGYFLEIFSRFPKHDEITETLKRKKQNKSHLQSLPLESENPVGIAVELYCWLTDLVGNPWCCKWLPPLAHKQGIVVVLGYQPKITSTRICYITRYVKNLRVRKFLFNAKKLTCSAAFLINSFEKFSHMEGIVRTQRMQPLSTCCFSFKASRHILFKCSMAFENKVKASIGLFMWSTTSTCWPRRWKCKNNSVKF